MELLLICALLGCIPGAIASSKGRSFFGWWLYGALLFIVALIHSLCISKDYKSLEHSEINSGLVKCPYCAELIKPEAVKCKHCGSEVEGLSITANEQPVDDSYSAHINFGRLMFAIAAAIVFYLLYK